MSEKTMTLRELNRATLARQMLLQREKVTPMKAIERLAGLQAQLPRPPFVGLLSRVEEFSRASLQKHLSSRKVVRGTMMRGTLHLMSAKDYLAFRPTIQPVLTRGMQSVLRKRADDLDVKSLVAIARKYFGKEPRSFNEFREHLASVSPEGDVRAMAYAVRTHLPLLQVPEETEWGFPGTADFTPADKWLGVKLDLKETRPHALVHRYLAAFGPATPGDMQTWSGLQGLKDVFEELRPKLSTLRDERGRELFDLPKAPRPSARTTAPVRFLPDYDNLVMAHDDRTRLIADKHRPKICLKNLRILPTFLVDGMAAGLWKIESTARVARLVVEPFESLSKRARDELTKEGKAMLDFVEPDAKSVEVKFA